MSSLHVTYRPTVGVVCRVRLHLFVSQRVCACRRGEAAETSLSGDALRRQVNYLGQLAVLKTLLPSMLERRSGHVLCVSSIQGRIAIPYR